MEEDTVFLEATEGEDMVTEEVAGMGEVMAVVTEAMAVAEDVEDMEVMVDTEEDTEGMEVIMVK
jgi:hypothetical protein